MTPESLHARILQAMRNELSRIVAELKASPPENLQELALLCLRFEADIAAHQVQP